jgi:hypothetical protein
MEADQLERREYKGRCRILTVVHGDPKERVSRNRLETITQRLGLGDVGVWADGDRQT